MSTPVRALREILLTVAACLGAVCLAAAVAAWIWHVKPLVFLSDSMSPGIPVGSLALAQTRPAEELEAGQVVSVPASSGSRVTHRVVGIEERGDGAVLTLQGDANEIPDSDTYLVHEADVVIWSAPHLGRVLTAAQEPASTFAVGLLVGVWITWWLKPCPELPLPREGTRAAERLRRARAARRSTAGPQRPRPALVLAGSDAAAPSGIEVLQSMVADSTADATRSRGPGATGKAPDTAASGQGTGPTRRELHRPADATRRRQAARTGRHPHREETPTVTRIALPSRSDLTPTAPQGTTRAARTSARPRTAPTGAGGEQRQIPTLEARRDPTRSPHRGDETHSSPRPEAAEEAPVTAQMVRITRRSLREAREEVDSRVLQTTRSR